MNSGCRFPKWLTFCFGLSGDKTEAYHPQDMETGRGAGIMGKQAKRVR